MSGRCRFWAWPWELARVGVLGMNARNLEMLLELNPRRLYRQVDDKLITKAIGAVRGIPAPETFAVLERFSQVRRLEALLGGREEFVIKPVRGAGGRGVLVIAGRGAAGYRSAAGQTVPMQELREHVAGILSGLHSPAGQGDRAMVEERIRPHPAWANLSAGGTPDVRIVLRSGRPLAAMLRLPTRRSDGRANLHQGAIGVGIDVSDGATTLGVWRGRRIERHPDTGLPLGGRVVPRWAEAVDVAARLGAALELGYVGVDLVLDERRGPVVLEANARPGLAIQIANRYGLRQCP